MNASLDLLLPRYDFVFCDTGCGLDNLVIFPAMLGDPYSQVEEQLERFAADVMPQLG